MSKFTNVLIVSPYPDGKTWYLRSAFGYDRGAKDSGNTIMVPLGFATDFASIPRLFWTILPKWGKYGNAAVVHDYLYFQQELPRKEADGIFREAMGVLNVAAWQKFAIYHAVRWFGFLAWRLNQKKKQAGYSKIALSAPVKAGDMPLHWKIGKREWMRILLKKGHVKQAAGS
jgi:hypothetical protein